MSSLWVEYGTDGSIELRFTVPIAILALTE
jgi:hypothetical protein